MFDFFWKLIRKWYVSTAAIVGLLDVAGKLAKAVGLPLPEWPVPSCAVFAFLLATVFYGAYSLRNEAFEKGHTKGKADALTEGALRADILTDATNAYPSNDKSRLYVLIHLIVRSSGQSAVKLTNLRLVDGLRQEYQPIPRTELILTIGGQVRLGPGTYFWPSRIVTVEPGKPLEVAAVLATEKPDWAQIRNRISYALTIEDDYGRSVRVPFTCPLQYFEMI
jgi:hypothetical protein